MATELERQEHDQRISNLRVALQIAFVGPAKPGEARELGRLLDDELARCRQLGCFAPLWAVAKMKP